MLKTKIIDGKTIVPLSELQDWDENPREITKQNFADLKEKIVKWGQIRPMLVNTGKNWGSAGMILGGNMRYKAFEAIGVKDVWVSLVSPKDKKEAIELAIIDNESAGEYVPDKLAELVMPYRSDLNIAKLQVGLAHSITLENLMSSYGPSGSAMDKDNAPQLNPDEYNNAYIKQIVLYFPSFEFKDVERRMLEIKKKEGDQSVKYKWYEQVVAKCKKLMDTHKLESNTDIFLFLLDYYEDNKSS